MAMNDLKLPPLEYPLVQYITLNGTILFEEASNPLALSLSKPWITMLNREEDLFRLIVTYRIDPGNFPEPIDFVKFVVMFFVNVNVEDMKYRTIKITALGRPSPGMVQVKSVPRHYFYRPEVYMEIFDEKGHLMRINRETYPVRNDLRKINNE